jgi:hypothetical protein
MQYDSLVLVTGGSKVDISKMIKGEKQFSKISYEGQKTQRTSQAEDKNKILKKTKDAGLVRSQQIDNVKVERRNTDSS